MLDDDDAHAGMTRDELLKKGAAGAVLLGGASLLGAARPALAQSLQAGATRGGKLIVGLGQTFEDINVMTAFGYRWSQIQAFAMYDTLVKFDSHGRPMPLLATSWQTPNPRTTIVKIRKGVKFHDGTDMRVEDVIWSLNRINDPSKPISTNFLPLPKGIWDKAVKIDDSTLRITTKKPTRMVENWRFWFIMPANADTRSPILGIQPVGTGPFQFDNFVKGDRLELKRFPNYWQSGRPYLDELTFKYLADTSAQVANFLSGDVQYLHDIPVATLPQVEGKRNSALIPSGLFFEWWQPQLYFGPLTDVNVRRALMYAFDRKTVNKVAWGGRGVDTWNPFDKSPYYIGKKWPVSFDPDRAKRMLAKAGQPRLKLNMMIWTDPGTHHRESDVLQQGFKQAGIQANIQALPPAQWFDRLYTKRNHDGIAVNAGSLPFPWRLIANYMLQATLPKNPPKYKKSAIPALEAAYNTAFASSNEAQYASALKAVQRLMLSEAAVYHTMLAASQNVAPKNLKGMESTVFGDQRFAGAYLA